MKQEHYVKISNYFRRYSWGEKLVTEINRWATKVVYVSFISVLALMLWEKDERLLRVVLTTGISFLIVTIFRKLYNSKRPYIVYDFKPLIKKEKSGESMPSRHVFSAIIIAIAFLYTYPILSIPMFICAIVIAVGRVIGGVHFIKDVVAGALIGVICGIIGFYII